VHDYYLPETAQHERAMTNTIHLLELLQLASERHRQPKQLVDYLGQQINLADEDLTAELRLESDGKLIRIITQHGSKGLEYPIVFVPFASRYSDPCRRGSQLLDVHHYHDLENANKITQLGHDPQGIKQASEQANAEAVRLLYVAITRAIHRCYLGVTPFANSQHSALGRALNITKSAELYPALKSLADSEPESIRLTTITTQATAAGDNITRDEQQAAINVPDFKGHIERNWWLSSFSALTRNLRHGGSVSLPEREDDDLNSQPPTADDQLAPMALELRFALKKGADTGNLLHDILERVDFSAPQLALAAQKPLSRYQYFPPEYSADDLYLWLNDILSSELPALHGERGPRLADLSRAQTVRESEFYFPMQNLAIEKLSNLLSAHRQQDSSINLISLPGRKNIQGMMHGYIDLIFCWQGKYYLADYKSTHLGNKLEDYSADKITVNMHKSYYDLQYLLYSLALHRYLKHRLPDYQIDKHFGGVYYLYLRGMQPNATTGVYAQALDQSLLTALDALFSAHQQTDTADTPYV
jgi:exodeoxyribonuclease V beta subunit